MKYCLSCVCGAAVFARSEQTETLPHLWFALWESSTDPVFLPVPLPENKRFPEWAGNEQFLPFYMLLTLGQDRQEGVVWIVSPLCHWLKGRRSLDVGRFWIYIQWELCLWFSFTAPLGFMWSRCAYRCNQPVKPRAEMLWHFECMGGSPI